MNYYAKAIELIVNLDRQLTDVEKYVAIHNPSLLVKALNPTKLYRVILTNPGEKKISCIKEIRALTNLGLKEAKEATESTPFVLADSVPLSEAMRITERFDAIGALTGYAEYV